MLDKIEQFLIECRKTKTKVITLTNHNGRRQFNEPIRTRSKCIWSAPSAGKRVQAIHDCVLDPRTLGLFFGFGHKIEEPWGREWSRSLLFFFFFFNNFTFIDKTHITAAKFKTKRKYITILQIGSKLHRDEKE